MTPYLVNPYSGVVHRPDCKHARGPDAEPLPVEPSRKEASA